jgi:single-stranded-DNA-specific exonuclease
MNNVWQVKTGGKRSFSSVEHIKSILLQQRGVTSDAEAGFFEPRYSTGIHDPYLLKGMQLAVDRIYEAIAKDEHILVYGDYDVDGVSSTAVMVSVLQDLGAKVVPFIPHRSDNGYGLDKQVLKTLINNFDLLITVDCGVSNFDEIEWLNKKGKETIITDHHVLPKILPEAVAVLHTCHPEGDYPFKYLCGVAMSWKLATALLRDKRCGLENTEERIKEMIDLVCLGTIADMVPLIGENRIIVKYGLRMLAQSRRKGVQVMVNSLGAGARIDTESVSFKMGPLINAAGRIDHAQPALDLLLEDDNDEAMNHLSLLRKLNNKRRKVGLAIQSEAEEISGEGSGPVIFAANPSWPVGVVGLVAGRLCDRFGKPALVVGGANGKAVGSARAPKGVSVLKLIEGASDHLIRFGGHERAAGFTLEEDQINNFAAALVTTAKKQHISENVVNVERADLVMNQELVNWDLVETISQMEPFGQGNEQPKFVFQGVYLGDWRKVGKTGEHIKMSFNMNEELVDGIGFGLAKSVEEKGIQPKDVVDLLGNIEINEYNGRRTLQVKVIDVQKAGEVSITEENNN